MDRLPRPVFADLGRVRQSGRPPAESTLANIRYETFDSDLPDLEMISMTISGPAATTPRLMRFINGIGGANKVFFLIGGLALADQKGGAVVNLDLNLGNLSAPDGRAESRPG